MENFIRKSNSVCVTNIRVITGLPRIAINNVKYTRQHRNMEYRKRTINQNVNVHVASDIDME